MSGTRIVWAERKLPEFAVSNDDLSELVDTSDEWIVKRSGIKTRKISRGETVSTLSAAVFRQLLAKTGRDPSEIDLLALATVTPEYLTPQSSAFVLGEVGAKNAFAIDINAACTGFVYALSVADKMIRSGVYKRAVVIGADTLSKIVDWSDRGTCILFGDGAGGVIIEASDGASCILAEDLHTDGEHAGLLRGTRIPLNNAWHKDQDEPVPYVVMDGHAVYDFTITEVPKSIRAALDKAALTMDDIKYVICHQANIRIIEGIAKKLKVGIDKFYISISRYGNTSSSSMPIALSEMLEQGLVAPGDKIIIAGFGAGLTWGSLLIEL